MLDMIDGWHRGECNGMELLLYKTMCKYICFGYYLLQLLQQYAFVSTILF